MTLSQIGARMTMPNGFRARLNLAALSRQRSAPRRGFQIGPKIRIGGDIGKLGQKVKETVGKGAKLASVPVSFFNPALGAALAVGGKALDTTDGGSSLADLAMTGVKSYGTGKLVGPLVRALPGVGAIGDKLGGLAGKIPGATAAGSIFGGSSAGGSGAPWDEQLPSIPGAPGGMGDFSLPGGVGGGAPGSSGGGIDWSNILGNIGGYVKDHPLDTAMGGLAAAQALAAAKASQRAGQLQDKALGLADSNWEFGAPLRTQGRTRLMDPRSTDLSDVYTDPTNPFARPRARALAVR